MPGLPRSFSGFVSNHPKADPQTDTGGFCHRLQLLCDDGPPEPGGRVGGTGGAWPALVGWVAEVVFGVHRVVHMGLVMKIF